MTILSWIILKIGGFAWICEKAHGSTPIPSGPFYIFPSFPVHLQRQGLCLGGGVCEHPGDQFGPARSRWLRQTSRRRDAPAAPGPRGTWGRVEDHLAMDQYLFLPIFAGLWTSIYHLSIGVPRLPFWPKLDHPDGAFVATNQTASHGSFMTTQRVLEW